MLFLLSKSLLCTVLYYIALLGTIYSLFICLFIALFIIIYCINTFLNFLYCNILYCHFMYCNIYSVYLFLVFTVILCIVHSLHILFYVYKTQHNNNNFAYQILFVFHFGIFDTFLVYMQIMLLSQS